MYSFLNTDNNYDSYNKIQENILLNENSNNYNPESTSLVNDQNNSYQANQLNPENITKFDTIPKNNDFKNYNINNESNAYNDILLGDNNYSDLSNIKINNILSKKYHEELRNANNNLNINYGTKDNINYKITNPVFDNELSFNQNNVNQIIKENFNYNEGLDLNNYSFKSFDNNKSEKHNIDDILNSNQNSDDMKFITDYQNIENRKNKIEKFMAKPLYAKKEIRIIKLPPKLLLSKTDTEYIPVKKIQYIKRKKTEVFIPTKKKIIVPAIKKLYINPNKIDFMISPEKGKVSMQEKESYIPQLYTSINHNSPRDHRQLSPLPISNNYEIKNELSHNLNNITSYPDFSVINNNISQVQITSPPKYNYKSNNNLDGFNTNNFFSPSELITHANYNIFPTKNNTSVSELNSTFIPKESSIIYQNTSIPVIQPTSSNFNEIQVSPLTKYNIDSGTSTSPLKYNINHILGSQTKTFDNNISNIILSPDKKNKKEPIRHNIATIPVSSPVKYNYLTSISEPSSPKYNFTSFPLESPSKYNISSVKVNSPPNHNINNEKASNPFIYNVSSKKVLKQIPHDASSLSVDGSSNSYRHNKEIEIYRELTPLNKRYNNNYYRPKKFRTKKYMHKNFFNEKYYNNK